MARFNVWVPDDLAARARALGLNVSALTQAALERELARHATDDWLDRLPSVATMDEARGSSVSHASALAALDDARGEFGLAEPETTPGADQAGAST
ncbi:type II toxin-antitoxin system CcdA family antitoxin [Actinomycetospora cinnamomea]|uniref:type II toxin-antitoxin system CcdA family antitoxin n=1 Tax=Actinomycetospora cinnamomea TaxID=663609 RepID=UPI000E31496B|nr:type II toxin-antitoxin system CcdA family antitoxin [Actinomycetospora cinnamomea]